VILSAVLYGCETWFLILREEHRLRVFENIVSSWRKLHNDELYNLYSSPNIVRMNKSRGMRWAGHVACMDVGERCLQGFCWEARK
jgi:hypothetical protein